MTYEPPRFPPPELARCFHDGRAARRRNAPEPHYWDMIDLGFRPEEALFFIRGYRSVRS